MFNGIRMNMLGDNITAHAQGYDYARYNFITKDTWPSTIDKLKDLNIRVIRFHQQPAPLHVIEAADEKGMLIIDESPVYAREYIRPTDKAGYIANAKTWLGPWIKARRNHPSIIMWSAENEMGAGWLNWMTSSEIKSLGDEIRRFDTSRPVNYDGDEDVGDAVVNFHYPEGYLNPPSGSIYSWESLVSSKPTGVGEFLTSYDVNGEENQWWHGIWVRGMRYGNFADIRPYTLNWAWQQTPDSLKVLNLKNCYAPIALFDKDYDDLGISPYLTGTYPILSEGETVDRTLVLYNDEFRDSVIAIEVLLKSGGITHAEGVAQFNVTLGNHIDIPISFQVPNIGGNLLEMVLTSSKNGVNKFEETRMFQVEDAGFNGTSSPAVVIEGGGASVRAAGARPSNPRPRIFFSGFSPFKSTHIPSQYPQADQQPGIIYDVNGRIVHSTEFNNIQTGICIIR
jgi:hypothetical protein